jgi:hypothetical protein
LIDNSKRAKGIGQFRKVPKESGPVNSKSEAMRTHFSESTKDPTKSKLYFGKNGTSHSGLGKRTLGLGTNYDEIPERNI